MTLRTKAWVTAISLVVLAVAGEFLGAHRRRVLRRSVPGAKVPALQPGQFVVRVIGADGRPVPQASVAALTFAGPPGRRSGMRRTGGMTAGFCVFGPRDEGWEETWIEVSGPSDTADAALPFGAVIRGPVPRDAASFDIVLPPEGVLTGSIRATGVPFFRVTVKARMAYPPDFEFLSASVGDQWLESRVAGPDGVFRIGRLGDGPREVAFDASPGFAVAGRIVGEGEALEMLLDEAKAAVVTVKDWNGRAVAGALVVVEEDSPMAPGSRRLRARGTTDQEGKVRIHGLEPAGRYRLRMHRPGSGPGSPGEERAWTPSPATFTLDLQRSVWVRVVDANGKPHVGAQVTASPRDPTKRSVSGSTGADGRCALHGIDAGPLRVSVLDTCRFLPATGVTAKDVAEGERETVFVLDRGPEISVKVDGMYGSNPAWACLREEGGAAATGGAVVNGRVTWHTLDPSKTYAAVFLDAPRFLAARADGLRPGGLMPRATLAPALELRVTVQWPEGAQDRTVAASWGDMQFAAGISQQDGTWILTCLPEGRYVVKARCTVRGRAEPATGSAEATAGGAATIVVK